MRRPPTWACMCPGKRRSCRTWEPGPASRMSLSGTVSVNIYNRVYVPGSSTLISDGICTSIITRGIGLAAAAMRPLQTLWQQRSLLLSAKLRFITTCQSFYTVARNGRSCPATLRDSSRSRCAVNANSSKSVGSTSYPMLLSLLAPAWFQLPTSSLDVVRTCSAMWPAWTAPLRPIVPWPAPLLVVRKDGPLMTARGSRAAHVNHGYSRSATARRQPFYASGKSPQTVAILLCVRDRRYGTPLSKWLNE